MPTTTIQPPLIINALSCDAIKQVRPAIVTTVTPDMMGGLFDPITTILSDTHSQATVVTCTNNIVVVPPQPSTVSMGIPPQPSTIIKSIPSQPSTISMGIPPQPKRTQIVKKARPRCILRHKT